MAGESAAGRGAVRDDGLFLRNIQPKVLRDYGGEILMAGINYDTVSQKRTCRIEKYVF